MTAIRVGHLYPDYLNIYADRGNIAVFTRRAALRGHDPVVHPQRRHLELVPTPRGPALEHGDVAAVGVDVEVVRIEVADPNGGHRERSQYGFASPREASTCCRPSIAV